MTLCNLIAAVLIVSAGFGSLHAGKSGRGKKTNGSSQDRTGEHLFRGKIKYKKQPNSLSSSNVADFLESESDSEKEVIDAVKIDLSDLVSFPDQLLRDQTVYDFDKLVTNLTYQLQGSVPKNDVEELVEKYFNPLLCSDFQEAKVKKAKKEFLIALAEKFYETDDQDN